MSCGSYQRPRRKHSKSRIPKAKWQEEEHLNKPLSTYFSKPQKGKKRKRRRRKAKTKK